jgi:hypothetical protein
MINEISFYFINRKWTMPFISTLYAQAFILKRLICFNFIFDELIIYSLI